MTANKNSTAQEAEINEVTVSGEGNGLVDDETSGGAAILQPDTTPGKGKTANEINGKEGDADSASQ